MSLIHDANFYLLEILLHILVHYNVVYIKTFIKMHSYRHFLLTLSCQVVTKGLKNWSWLSLSPPPLLKSLCPVPSFLFHSLFRYSIKTVPPTLTQIPPALIWPTNLPWFEQISKVWIYQFNCCFLSKMNFNLLNPFTNRLS